MKICVTGGAGYIGSVAIFKLIEAGYQVVVFDDLSTGYMENVPPQAKLFIGSLSDMAALESALVGCEAVMHFAGKSLVGESVEKPDLYDQINVSGSANLFNAMKKCGVNKLVFSSSAAVYGEPKETPIKESADTQPTNPYGQTKLDVERLISKENFNSVSLRYFNVAGSYKQIHENHQPETHLIPNIKKATKDKPISVFGTDWPTPDGTCIRDYVHVSDIADAHVLALKNIEEFKAEVINLGSGTGYSVKEVIAAAGPNVPTKVIGRRAGDPAVLLADISKAKAKLGWQPKFGLIDLFS